MIKKKKILVPSEMKTDFEKSKFCNSEFQLQKKKKSTL